MLILPAWARADQTIYRCQKDGQLLLTDQPCDGSPKKSANPSASQPAAPAETTLGDWHGTAELSLNQNGKPVALQNASTVLDLRIDPHGHLSGSLHQGNCRLDGDLGTSYTEGDHAVDAQLTQCSFAPLNLRYTGHLTVGTRGLPIHLVLSGLSGYTQGKNFAGASLKASLQRAAASKPAGTP